MISNRIKEVQSALIHGLRCVGKVCVIFLGAFFLENQETRRFLKTPGISVVERLRNWSRVKLVTIWNRFEMGGPYLPVGTIDWWNNIEQEASSQHASVVPVLCESAQVDFW